MFSVHVEDNCEVEVCELGDDGDLGGSTPDQRINVEIKQKGSAVLDMYLPVDLANDLYESLREIFGDSSKSCDGKIMAMSATDKVLTLRCQKCNRLFSFENPPENWNNIDTTHEG